MEHKTDDLMDRCRDGNCGLQIKGDFLACGSGSSCKTVEFLSAAESPFHDQCLIDATVAIKQILANIPADPNGRKISFINTNMGTLLAWVDHNLVLEGAVTEDDDDATIAAALRLIYETQAGAKTAS